MLISPKAAGDGERSSQAVVQWQNHRERSQIRTCTGYLFAEMSPHESGVVPWPQGVTFPRLCMAVASYKHTLYPVFISFLWSMVIFLYALIIPAFNGQDQFWSQNHCEHIETCRHVIFPSWPEFCSMCLLEKRCISKYTSSSLPMPSHSLLARYHFLPALPWREGLMPSIWNNTANFWCCFPYLTLKISRKWSQIHQTLYQHAAGHPPHIEKLQCRNNKCVSIIRDNKIAQK